MALTKLSFQSRAEWLTARQNGIGGSDVAVLFDLVFFFSVCCWYL